MLCLSGKGCRFYLGLDDILNIFGPVLSWIIGFYMGFPSFQKCPSLSNKLFNHHNLHSRILLMLLTVRYFLRAEGHGYDICSYRFSSKFERKLKHEHLRSN